MGNKPTIADDALLEIAGKAARILCKDGKTSTTDAFPDILRIMKLREIRHQTKSSDVEILVREPGSSIIHNMISPNGCFSGKLQQLYYDMSELHEYLECDSKFRFNYEQAVLFQCMQVIHAGMLAIEYDSFSAKRRAELMKYLKDNYSTDWAVKIVDINSNLKKESEAWHEKIYAHRRQKKDLNSIEEEL